MPDNEREMWDKVLCADMMSSEDIDSDNNEIIIAWSLIHGRTLVTQFFQSLDEKVTESKTSQAKHPQKEQVIVTSVSKPLGTVNIPTLAFTPNAN